MFRPIRPASSCLRRLALSTAGNLTIEFAFLVPVLMMLSFGALELGNIFLQHLRMTGAARAGAPPLFTCPFGRTI